MEPSFWHARWQAGHIGFHQDRPTPLMQKYWPTLGLDAATLAGCDAVFDRAALIALPPDLRRRYADELHAHLPRGCRGLLVTLEYPQAEKAGPPFSIDAHEVHALFARDWNVELLDRREILDAQPAFREEGVTSLHTAVYRLERR